MYFSICKNDIDELMRIYFCISAAFVLNLESEGLTPTQKCIWDNGFASNFFSFLVKINLHSTFNHVPS